MNIRGFLSLIRKYKEGGLSSEKRQMMDRWYDTIGEEPEEVGERDQLRARIWDRIVLTSDKQDVNEEIVFKRNRWRRLPEYLVSGMVVLFLVAGWFYYMRSEKTEGETIVAEIDREEWVLTENLSSDKKVIILPDSSRVVLQPGSMLRYPKLFGEGSRTVEMEGSALFDVVGDPDRPFFARAGEVLVSVLGTSFTISETETSHATEVAVIRGKVMVEKRPDGREERGGEIADNQVVLTPNKKVTFYKDSDRYVTGLVDNPVILEKFEDLHKPQSFDFDDMLLSDILRKLESAYGVSISVSDESLLHCRITADLSSDNLYGKIEVISAILNAGYEIKGSEILLSGGVCKVF